MVPTLTQQDQNSHHQQGCADGHRDPHVGPGPGGLGVLDLICGTGTVSILESSIGSAVHIVPLSGSILVVHARASTNPPAPRNPLTPGEAWQLIEDWI